MNYIRIVFIFISNFLARERQMLLYLAVFAALIVGGRALLMSGLRAHMPADKIDHTLLRERLFVNVRQDSLAERARSMGFSVEGPSLLGSRATVSLPQGSSLADKRLHAELDSLAAVYSHDLQLSPAEGGGLTLSCPTVRQGGTRFVTMPVALMAVIMAQPASAAAPTTSTPQP